MGSLYTAHFTLRTKFLKCMSSKNIKGASLMWTVKHIYEADFGCEERMPGEPLTSLVVLESDTGEVMQVEVADKWLTFMDMEMLGKGINL